MPREPAVTSSPEARQIAGLLSSALERQADHLEAVATIAAETLRQWSIAEPLPKAVDERWLARFIAAARPVADPVQQACWGRLLARKLAGKPVSLRTLGLLADLSEVEFDAVAGWARYVIADFAVQVGDDLFDKQGFPLDRRLLLQELGIVRSTGDAAKSFGSMEAERFITHLIYRATLLRITSPLPASTLFLPCYRLTNPAAELMTAFPAEEDVEYLIRVVNRITEQGFKVEQATIQTITPAGVVLKHSRFVELIAPLRRRGRKR